MSNKKILGITVAAIITAGMLSACGTVADTDQKSNNTDVTEDTIVAEDTIETDEVIEEEPSFGLQDFEGLYCVTGTEEIEDYEVPYTYGVQFNGDGTGVCYGQDVVDITWNETEIHFADRTVPFVMEPGKLTFENITYDKIKGNFITPNPYDVDINNIDNGIYNAYIDKSGVNEDDGKFTISAELFTEESYDIVDINRMAEGDAIYINGSLQLVKSINRTDSGIININGGIENYGSALVAVDESNCFVYAGMDMERSYSRHGIASFSVNDDVRLVDNSDPSEEKDYTGSDAISALNAMLEDYPLTCYNCSITVENSEIVEIRRLYTP